MSATATVISQIVIGAIGILAIAISTATTNAGVKTCGRATTGVVAMTAIGRGAGAMAADLTWPDRFAKAGVIGIGMMMTFRSASAGGAAATGTGTAGTTGIISPATGR